MTLPNMDATLAAVVAVDAANLHCRNRGKKPSNLGPWPAAEWNNKEWKIYYKELVRCWKMFEPQLANAMELDFIKSGKL